MQKKILFIGGGNMTRAIVTGLIKGHYSPKLIYVVDRNLPKRDFFEKTLQVHAAENFSEFLPTADIVVLSIKPQSAEILCQSLHEKITHQLIISVMAGITIEKLSACLGGAHAIVRAMPNTPAKIGEGATGLFANAHVTQEQKNITEAMMKSAGIIAWLETESQLNIITALSGSGPAYYLYFIEIMQNIAIKRGLPENIASTFAVQTAFGAAQLAHESQEAVKTLRQHSLPPKKKGPAPGLIIKKKKKKNFLFQQKNFFFFFFFFF